MNALHKALLANTGRSDCLSDGQVDHYVRKQMNREEEYKLEQHLLECHLCRDVVEGAAMMTSEAADRHADALRQRLFEKAPTHQPRFWPAWTYGLAAAAVILIVWGINSQYTPNPDEQLFASEFRPYSSVIPQVRGEAASDAILSALRLYEMENYDAAIHEFETMIAREPDHTLAHFYLGNALLATGRANEAVGHLQSAASGDVDDRLTEPARWYLALAYVKISNRSAAQTILKSVAIAQGVHASKADAMLKRMNP